MLILNKLTVLIKLVRLKSNYNKPAIKTNSNKNKTTLCKIF